MDYQVKQKELVKEAMFFAQYEEMVVSKEQAERDFQKESEEDAHELISH